MVYKAIINALRDANLEWIARSIEAEVSSDRQPDETEGQNNDSRNTDYSPREKLAIALRIVMEYSEVPFAMWQETQEYFKKRLDIVEEVEEESNKRYLPFGEQFEGVISSLRSIVEKISKEFKLTGPDADIIDRKPMRALSDENVRK